MRRKETELFSESELRIYSLIARKDGIKAREIARELEMDKSDISRWMVSSALMRELCYQDREYGWYDSKGPMKGCMNFPAGMERSGSSWRKMRRNGWKNSSRAAGGSAGI